MKKLKEWNELHSSALQELDKDWRNLKELKKIGSVVAFDDLVAWNYADRLQEPILRNGIASGEYLYYRKGKGLTLQANAIKFDKNNCGVIATAEGRK